MAENQKMGISQDELDERVAIVKRFRDVLEQQRDKFREYLTVLEKQHEKIASGDAESVEIHSKIQERIVVSIGELQKVVAPMEALYKRTHASDSYIPEIQTELLALKQKAGMQNALNQDLLRLRLKDVQKEMLSFKNPYRNARSVYEKSSGTAKVIKIDI